MASGNIRKRINNNGTYSYQVTAEGERDPITGKRNRVYRTVKTKKEATAILHQMIHEMENDGITKPSKMSVGEWMTTWFDTYLPNIAATTKASYKDNIYNHIIPTLGKILLKNLNAHQIQSWVNHLQTSKNLSPKTIKNIFRNLNAALDKAVKLQLLPFNPCAAVDLPKQPKVQFGYAMTSDEIDTTLKAAKSTDIRLLFMLGIYSGLRRGELVALKWENVDFDNNIIQVHFNTVMADGQTITKDPKSQTSIRNIVVIDDLMCELKKARAEYLKNMISHGKTFTNSNLVFCQKNGKAYRPDSVTQKWDRFRKTVNLDHVRLHDLRHTYATMLVAAGVDVKTAQTWLGHSDPNITLSIYAHYSKTGAFNSIRKLEEYLSYSTAS